MTCPILNPPQKLLEKIRKSINNFWVRTRTGLNKIVARPEWVRVEKNTHLIWATLIKQAWCTYR